MNLINRISDWADAQGIDYETWVSGLKDVCEKDYFWSESEQMSEFKVSTNAGSLLGQLHEYGESKPLQGLPADELLRWIAESNDFDWRSSLEEFLEQTADEDEVFKNVTDRILSSKR